MKTNKIFFNPPKTSLKPTWNLVIFAQKKTNPHFNVRPVRRPSGFQVELHKELQETHQVVHLILTFNVRGDFDQRFHNGLFQRPAERAGIQLGADIKGKLQGSEIDEKQKVKKAQYFIFRNIPFAWKSVFIRESICRQ